jgi:hypothetical protein
MSTAHKQRTSYASTSRHEPLPTRNKIVIHCLVRMNFSSLRTVVSASKLQGARLCTSFKPRYQRPVGKNVALAVSLLGFVVAVYYTAIGKMRQVLG